MPNVPPVIPSLLNENTVFGKCDSWNVYVVFSVFFLVIFFLVIGTNFSSVQLGITIVLGFDHSAAESTAAGSVNGFLIA